MATPAAGYKPGLYEDFFNRYAAMFEEALNGHFDPDRIRAFFAEHFVSAALSGGIEAGANDDRFTRALTQGYDFYRQVGMKAMRVERVEVTSIADNHDSVRVFYHSPHQRKDGASIQMRFDVVYLLQKRADGPRIFAYITGNELGLYRQHGLVDEAGKPV